MSAVSIARISNGPIDRSFDLAFVLSAIALIGVGLVMVASASISMADRSLGSPFHFFWRQLAALVVGVGLGTIVVAARTRIWQRFADVGLVAGIAMLSAVLVPGLGLEANGAVRWLDLGVATFHPAEAVKILLVVYVASFLARYGEEIRRHGRYALIPMGLFGLVALLLLAEPDFGSVVVMGCTLVGMLFVAGLPLGTCAAWAVVAGASLAALAVAAPYRMVRLLTFLDPWATPFAEGFQLTQALIAIGRGEWLGVGLGGSVQKLFYLPAAHTDFLFAVIGEEFGFAGMAAIIVLFGILIWRTFEIAFRALDRGQTFNAHLAYGLGLSIGLQAWINIGVNLGALPTKGLALPFMSYGGNNLVASCIALALIARVDRETRE